MSLSTKWHCNNSILFLLLCVSSEKKYYILLTLLIISLLFFPLLIFVPSHYNYYLFISLLSVVVAKPCTHKVMSSHLKIMVISWPPYLKSLCFPLHSNKLSFLNWEQVMPVNFFCHFSSSHSFTHCVYTLSSSQLPFYSFLAPLKNYIAWTSMPFFPQRGVKYFLIAVVILIFLQCRSDLVLPLTLCLNF